MSGRKRADGRVAAADGVEEIAAASSVAPLSNQMLMRAMSQPGDAVEREAEHVAGHGGVVRQAVGGGGGGVLPRVVAEALATSGQALDDGTLATMQARFGRDLSGVRVHTGGAAARSAAQVSAAAYTVGSDIVFGGGRYDPGSEGGRHLLAHELTHVVQGGGQLRRFHIPNAADPRDETPLIAGTYAELLNVLKSIIGTAVSHGTQVDMDKFVKLCGGRPATAAVKMDSSGDQPYMLTPRYLLTRRAGMLDMRHFIQLMYIANFSASSFPGTDGNRVATRKGREHELDSEPESRFGAEDTTSNAIGAYTGSRLAGLPQRDDLYNTIEAMLSRCDPVDFSSLSSTSKNVVVHFYGDLVADPSPKSPGDMVPANQNEKAVPPLLDIPEFAGKERSFPFVIDPDDPKTITDTDFIKGALSVNDDDDVREYTFTQRPEVIRMLTPEEKVRMCVLAFEGWVADGDLDAITVIYRNASDPEKARIRAAIDPNDLSGGQKTRLKLLFSS